MQCEERAALAADWSKAVEELEAAVTAMRANVNDTGEKFSEAKKRVNSALASAEDARTKVLHHRTQHGC